MALTAAQVKGRIKSLADKSEADPRVLMRMYMMERFLERVSLSEYQENFIIKGGILVSSMVGVSMRSTMDIDTSIRNRELTIENALNTVETISNIVIDDGVNFVIKNAENIMDEMEYPGIRISLDAVMEKMTTPIKLDISTGDVVTPRAIEYQYPLMLEDRTIKLWSYNLETVLAEKVQTILVRERANTRMRDFYDLYTLLSTHHQDINYNVLKTAYAATCEKRESTSVIGNEEAIIENIEKHPALLDLWRQYQEKYLYASDITYQQVIDSVRKIVSYIK